jgi:hypothetical protein
MAFLAHATGLAWVCRAAAVDHLQLRGSHDCGRTSYAIWVLVFRINTADWTVEVEISQRPRELTHRAGPLASRHKPASDGGIRRGGKAIRRARWPRSEVIGDGAVAEAVKCEGSFLPSTVSRYSIVESNVAGVWRASSNPRVFSSLIESWVFSFRFAHQRLA